MLTKQYRLHLAKNQRDNTLSWFGKFIAFILDTIDKNHCEKSIDKYNNLIQEINNE